MLISSQHKHTPFMATSEEIYGKIVNLTPHVQRIVYSDGGELEIPSSGELRLRSHMGPPFPLHHWLHLDEKTQEQSAIPVVGRQVFAGLDTSSPGFEVLQKSEPKDAVIVSMVVADYLATVDRTILNIPKVAVFAPSTKPGNVVRDNEGQIRGVRALEFYGYT